MSEQLPKSSTSAEDMIAQTRQATADQERFEAWTGVEDVAVGAKKKKHKKAVNDLSDFLEQRPDGSVEASDEIVVEDAAVEAYEPQSEFDQDLAYIQELFAESKNAEHRTAAFELFDEFVDTHDLSRAQERALRDHLLAVEVAEPYVGRHRKPEVAESTSDTPALEVGSEVEDPNDDSIWTVTEVVTNDDGTFSYELASADGATNKRENEEALDNWKLGDSNEALDETEAPEFKVGDVVRVLRTNGDVEEWNVASVTENQDGTISYKVENPNMVPVDPSNPSGEQGQEYKNITEEELLSYQNMQLTSDGESDSGIDVDSDEEESEAFKVRSLKDASLYLGAKMAVMFGEKGTEKGKKRRKYAIIAGVGIAAVTALAAFKYGTSHNMPTEAVIDSPQVSNTGGDIAGGVSEALGAAADTLGATTETLGKGDTIWDHAKTALIESGVKNPSNNEIVKHTQEVLSANDLTWKDAHHLPVGFTFKMPQL